MKTSKKQQYMNPYLAGVLLGFVLFVSFLVFGHGLGASGGVAVVIGKATELVSPEHINNNGYLVNLIKASPNPLRSWLVLEIVGVVLGGFISGLLAGRVKIETYRGPAVSIRFRWSMAMLGGAIAGFGVRMSRGCTSSQALSGGAILSAGSWVFMFSVFAGAYLAAYFVRKLWN